MIDTIANAIFIGLQLICLLAIVYLIIDLWRAELRSAKEDDHIEPALYVKGSCWVCETPRHCACCHVSHPNARQRAYRQWRAKHLGIPAPENDLELHAPSKEQKS